ncbi:MAG: type II toxin-antitoxin system prevent-host-death family antitoxin [Thermomicrobiales bacterium]
MREPEPETQIMEIAELESHIVGLVHDVARTQGRVLVEEEGAPVAALVSLDDYRDLKSLDAQRARRRRAVEGIRRAFRDLPPEEVERETAKALAEVRAEMRAEREAAAHP